MGAASLVIGASAKAAPEAPEPPGFKQWQESLLTPSEPRIYQSDIHTDARMHMGGIGTGNIELGVDGQFTTWNLFNTLWDGYVPLHFGLRAGGRTRLLQTAGGPDVPRTPHITMRGEYPIAELEFENPDLPVRARLSAMTPLVPLDVRASSMPAILLQFEITNRTAQAIPVSLAGFMLNPVGYEGKGSFDGACHPQVGANINQLERSENLAVLHMTARAGRVPELEQPVTVYTNRTSSEFVRTGRDVPRGLGIQDLSKIPNYPAEPATYDSKSAVPLKQKPPPHEIGELTLPDAAQLVIWIDSPDASIDPLVLSRALKAVQSGATLLISGADSPLLEAYGVYTGGKPTVAAPKTPRADLIIDDFETGEYRNWMPEGTAFGEGPAKGTARNQQVVSGYQGQYLVNSYLGSDEPQGTLTSLPFVVQRRFIRFLVGGGSSPQTAIRLLVGDKVVRTTSGRDTEKLGLHFWDVSQFAGQQARIQIIDHASGPWGHINVDDIVLTDSPGERAAFDVLDELLPARFSGVSYKPGQVTLPLTNAVGIPGALPKTIWMAGHQTFTDFSLAPAAVRSLDVDGGPVIITRTIGKGISILLAGPLIPTADTGPGSTARLNAIAFLSALGGVMAPVVAGTLPDAPGFGDFALGVSGALTTALLDASDLKAAWTEFEKNGRFAQTRSGARSHSSPPGCSVFGAVCSEATIPPNGTVKIPFMLSWRLPNLYAPTGELVGVYYANLWKDAPSVVRELAADPQNVVARTLDFRKTMYDSTLPYWLLDCFTSQLGTIRHVGVVFRLQNGDIYGWEGSNGCCQPTCTHVWGYEQTLSHIFPSLERQMRFIDFKHQQDPDGGIRNRTDWPSPPHPTGEQPFADGHASCILKAYRESLNTPDNSWLNDYWPNIRKAVDYLVGRDAAGKAPDGIIEDAQFNTYDDAIHGANSFIGGYYLAALRAGEEMANRVGDLAKAREWRGIFESGRRRLVDLCWNGEYFQQNLPDYAARSGEYGPGCLSDQLIGQWWANLLGLGSILPSDQVHKALASIFHNNWLPDMSNWVHHERWFAAGHDKGLLNCTWPHGGRPEHPIPYVDEVWTGVEYEVAGLMMGEGMLIEALSIAKGARDRYDGIPRPPIPRNPWNEIECGGHYARAMSSWGMLIALSGFLYDGPNRELTFMPRVTPDRFRCFFTGTNAWGSIAQERANGSQTNTIQVVEGALSLGVFTVEPPTGFKKVEAVADGEPQTPRVVHHEAVSEPGAPPLIELHFAPALAITRSLTVRFI